jgi:hypothetical protein
MFFRFLLYTLLFYFIFKIIKTIVRLLFRPSEKPKEPTVKNSPERKKFDIDSKDIIEAEFEEIKDNKNNNSN